MFQIDEDKTIYVTRGDVAHFGVRMESNGVYYAFRTGDIVRMKVCAKKDNTKVAFQKDFPVLQDTERVEILLTEKETRIGEVISKPVDYWYEIELNPYTNPQTIIGYDDDGPKIFKLFPEGKELVATDVAEEDIPVVDMELSLTSDRPVQNQAIARAITALEDRVQKASQNTVGIIGSLEENVIKSLNDMTKECEKINSELSVERSRLDALVTSNGVVVPDVTTLTFKGNGTCDSIKIYSNGIDAFIDIHALKWGSMTEKTWVTIAEIPDELLPHNCFEEGYSDRIGLCYHEQSEVDEAAGIKFALFSNRLQMWVTNASAAQSVSVSCVLPYPLKNPVLKELADMRIGFDGQVYESAGDAIRAQLETIEGFNGIVDVSKKMNSSNPTGTGSMSMNRKGGTTVGYNSTVFGAGNEASGNWSAAIGYNCTATAQCSVAIGNQNTASSAEDVALGNNNVASGGASAAIGAGNKATGKFSAAIGCENTALTGQMAIGHFNDTSVATENSQTGASSGTVFVIGNGSSSAKSNAFRVTGQGAVIGKSAYQATGADLAELREWIDGNPNDEDRRGYFVTMEGLKIRIARPGDYICGIISANPCLIGNADEDWLGRYVFDEFGAFVYETVEEVDEEGNVVTFEHYKMNPEYDPEREYVRREDRSEWDYVGLTGVISVRDDGTCEVDGFCKCSEGGIATKSERGYRVVERVNENIVKVLFYLTGEAF